MTMKNGWMLVLVTILLAGNSFGGLISWEYFNTPAGLSTLFGDPNTTIVAEGQFRAGGTTSPEIRVQNGEMDLGQSFDQGNLTWDITGGNNSLSAGFGTPELGGAFQLEATGAGGSTDSANSLPTQPYNMVLVEFTSDVVLGSLIGDMNGENFGLNLDWTTGNSDDHYEAVLFTFDNASGTTPVWEMSADMSMTTPFPELGADDFRSDITLIQNFEVVPEPATLGLFGLGLLCFGWASRFRRRSKKA